MYEPFNHRPSPAYALVAANDRDRILLAAERYSLLPPETITSNPSERNPGGPHDYFSEADYFWRNSADPEGPFLHRDGYSNPDNFQGHRKAMVAMSVQVPALAAAWMLTGERRFAEHAAEHLLAWFVREETRMNPHLEFSQGVQGVTNGSSWGVIDTLHLAEVARAASILPDEVLNLHDAQAVRNWFESYLNWMKTSENGSKERSAANNHATAWALQASEYARLIGDEETRRDIREWYRTVFLPDQMGLDGGFPRELARTKPYNYSIFNLEVVVTLCQSLSSPEESLFHFTLEDGRGACKAMEFLYPYLADKSKWPYAKDVEHFNSLPVRSSSLLFCGVACGREEYVNLWKRLDPDPTDREVIRNYPVRQPLLWLT